MLMADAERIARDAGCVRLSLEADARNERLVEWYRNQGFVVAAVLSDYYASGWDGVRMVRDLVYGGLSASGSSCRDGHR
jgi:ribosomal protein S18 acetylase RimI-like enzyme